LNQFNWDAFASGQIGSKIWLCEELEKTKWSANEAWIYAGWYGIAAFLLLSRGKFKIHKIRSIDIDPCCEPIADKINELYVWRDWTFKAVTGDCNKIFPQVDLIINTATEHFETKEWFDNIPYGTKLVLQGNNMPHDDHYIYSGSLKDFINHYPMNKIVYSGQLNFEYPSWKFSRFMIIGEK